jgi:hypothetical protein
MRIDGVIIILWFLMGVSIIAIGHLYLNMELKIIRAKERGRTIHRFTPPFYQKKLFEISRVIAWAGLLLISLFYFSLLMIMPVIIDYSHYLAIIALILSCMLQIITIYILFRFRKANLAKETNSGNLRTPFKSFISAPPVIFYKIFILILSSVYLFEIMKVLLFSIDSLD